jgi:hypothetical protein
VQLLFSTGKSFTVEKLREFFRHEVAVAALSNVELITALLSCNRQLALVGLQLRIINGDSPPSVASEDKQHKAANSDRRTARELARQFHQTQRDQSGEGEKLPCLRE